MSGYVRVSRHNHGVPIAPSAWKSTEVKRLAWRGLSPELRGYAPVSARNHADQPFGGGLGDNPRAIITSGRRLGWSAGRIVFDSLDYGDDRGSDDGVVTRGLAFE